MTHIPAPEKPSLEAISILPGTCSDKGSALVINLFGGPGSGKSTLAARLFYELKLSHIEAACPEEHAKLALWSGQPWLLDEQTVLLGRTWETIHALLDKVEVIIVDSPILLCSAYAGNREPDCFHHLVLDLHRRTNRVNLMIERDGGHAYSTNGRRETETEALHADQVIADTLFRGGEPCHKVRPGDEISAHLVSLLRPFV